MKVFFSKGLIRMSLLALCLLAAPVWAATDHAVDNAATIFSSPQTFPGSNYGPIPEGLAAAPGFHGESRDILFAVSGIAGTVTSVAVSFSAAHNWVGDLRVRLIAPNGKQHLLFDRTGATTAGGSGFSNRLIGANTYDFRDSNSSNWWTAAAAFSNIPSTNARTVVSGGAGVSNPAPVTSMNASFAATPVNGNWILRFEDGWENGIAGSVNAATLILGSTGVTRVVSSINDSGAGSLREAMTLATAGDLIAFDPVLFGTPQTIELLTTLPNISIDMAIAGPGANLLTVRRSDGMASFRIFNISTVAANVAISGMTISNGDYPNGGGIRSLGNLTLSRAVVSGNRASGEGGGIFIVRDGFIHASTIAGNTAGQGGGIAYEGISGNTLRLQDSTVSSNKASSYGGIVHYGLEGGSSTLEVVNSTIAYNSGTTESGGIGTYAESSGTIATTTLRNSIVANNSPNNAYSTAEGASVAATVSDGYNLSDDWNGLTLASSDITGNPRLGPLAPQGGTTPIHLLLGGSAALEKGNRSGSASDQRGAERAFDIASIPNASDGADIGAVEMQAIIVTTASDTGGGSLREAITSANGNGPGLDDIIFDNSLFTTPQTIPLATTLPNITSAVTLSGPGAGELTLRRDDGAPDFRIFTVLSGLEIMAISSMTITHGTQSGVYSASDLTLAEVALTNNSASFPVFNGGGLTVDGANALIIGSTINGNQSPTGGGIYIVSRNDHVTRLINSTISGNSATAGDGGGIFNLGFKTSSRLEIINSTLANNTATHGGAVNTEARGGGSSATTILRNSIFANNENPSFMAQFTGGSFGPVTFMSHGFNLASGSNSSSLYLDQPSDQISANAGLLPLADNGGPTFTHALTAFSDALDGGNNRGSGVTATQRGPGFARTVDLAITNVPGGDGTDVGAYEAQSEPINDRLFASGFDF